MIKIQKMFYDNNKAGFSMTAQTTQQEQYKIHCAHIFLLLPLTLPASNAYKSVWHTTSISFHCGYASQRYKTKEKPS
ncbi:MAG: hypothetical protein ACTS73_09265 [Arsenophonus sp. NEOnobi-MAG3]